MNFERVNRIINGKFIRVENKSDFKQLLGYGVFTNEEDDRQATIQKGYWEGPQDYIFIEESQRCPRGCCWDDVRHAMTKKDALNKVKEVVTKLNEFIENAK